MAVNAETCENCGATIQPLEQAYLWHRQVLCGNCIAKAQDLAQRCENCGGAIRTKEEARVWSDGIVCGACYAKLSTPLPDKPAVCEGCDRPFAEQQPTFSVNEKTVCLHCANAAGMQGVEIGTYAVGVGFVVGGIVTVLVALAGMSDEYGQFKTWPVPTLLTGIAAIPTGILFLLGARIAQTLRAIADKRKRL